MTVIVNNPFRPVYITLKAVMMMMMMMMAMFMMIMTMVVMG